MNGQATFYLKAIAIRRESAGSVLSVPWRRCPVTNSPRSSASVTE